MSFPRGFWTTGLEDEPCDGCGVKPSKHAGHGSYTCKKCYEARWCPKCQWLKHEGRCTRKRPAPPDRFDRIAERWLTTRFDDGFAIVHGRDLAGLLRRTVKREAGRA